MKQMRLDVIAVRGPWCSLTTHFLLLGHSLHRNGKDVNCMDRRLAERYIGVVRGWGEHAEVGKSPDHVRRVATYGSENWT